MLRIARSRGTPLLHTLKRSYGYNAQVGEAVTEKEHVVDAENAKVRATQAPNRKETWAVSQQPRAAAMTGPRFDGRDLSAQPQAYAAIELIAKEPIKFVHSVAVCDGNANSKHGGVQGHPKIFINVDSPGVHACQYCGNRFADEHFRAEIEAKQPEELPSGFGPYLPGSLGP